MTQTLTAADAQELCEQHYDSRPAAMEAGRRLSDGGWRVIYWPHAIYHPNGLVTVASVYHRDTHESPGDLLVVAEAFGFEHQRQPRPPLRRRPGG